MGKRHLPAWPLVVAALLAPAALAAQAGTLVCKDGSNGSSPAACASHGGVDSVATRAATNARGGVETGRVDTSRTGAAGVTDTTLKAKPGVQTGPTAADTGMGSDTSMTHKKMKHRRHAGAMHDSTHMRMHPDSTGMKKDSTQ